MATFIRCIRSDYHKFRHTSMLWIHILLPLAIAALFLAYFSISAWKPVSKISGYLEIIGVSFPLIIGIICGKAIEQEAESGNFQVMLCGIKSRILVYFSKLLVLVMLSIFSIAISIGIFAVGFKTVSALVYFKAAGLLIAGSIFLYILHIFISLQYGRGASIGLGIAESLISALALTGMGDGIWYYIPCTWGARFCDYVVFNRFYPAKAAIGSSEIQKGLSIAIVATLIAFVVSIMWFKNWEGRKSY